MKKVVILAPAGDTILSSITGPYEILTRADQHWRSRGGASRISVSIAGFSAPLNFDNGYFSLHPADIRAVKDPSLIIIPSVPYAPQLIADNAALIHWIRERHRQGAEIASICSGAFLLAATGLVDGWSCSTHWNNAAAFRALFPQVRLVTDKLITAENGIYTNGGAYSFLNLLLFLVEKLFDRDMAIWCAKTFQIDMDRNSQSRFLIFETQKGHGDELIAEAQAYIETHLADKFSFEEMASRLAVSRRNFDRRFIKATGNTPTAYLQRVKVEAAKMALESGRKNINEVMDAVGYADEKAFRDVFKRLTGLSPLDYKARYNSKALHA